MDILTEILTSLFTAAFVSILIAVRNARQLVVARSEQSDAEDVHVAQLKKMQDKLDDMDENVRSLRMQITTQNATIDRLERELRESEGRLNRLRQESDEKIVALGKQTKEQNRQIIALEVQLGLVVKAKEEIGDELAKARLELLEAKHTLEVQTMKADTLEKAMVVIAGVQEMAGGERKAPPPPETEPEGIEKPS